MTKISITKKELQTIIEALNAKKSFLINTDKRLPHYRKLINKFNELSPHFEYLLEPIQYDEF